MFQTVTMLVLLQQLCLPYELQTKDTKCARRMHECIGAEDRPGNMNPQEVHHVLQTTDTTILSEFVIQLRENKDYLSDILKFGSICKMYREYM